jgi:cysteine desulfurase/selenocysteine lyase
MTIKAFDIGRVRGDFRILRRGIRGEPLVYLDSAASALKPVAVIERLVQYYSYETANVHRGAHFLAELGTVAYEDARAAVRDFIHAKESHEVIFTKGTTEAINLVAQSFGRRFFNNGDEIVLSELEHHSNIVPWQLIAEEKGCKIKVIPITESGELDFQKYTELLSPRTKMVAITGCSNVLGTYIDVEKFVVAAHRVGAKVLIDGAQRIAQAPTDVKRINCDFYVFSGHKLFGPYGIGVLYAKEELLESMPPYQGGGSMISEVTWERTTWAALPHKFEAGTPPIAGALGLAAAVRYVKQIGFSEIIEHEHQLLEYARTQLNDIPGITIYGRPAQQAPILSFNLQGAHASDVGAILDQQGIAIRTGHHCCQPLMRRLGVSGTARASFSIYNNRQEVDILCEGLLKARRMFS